jgi:TolB protein
MHVFTVPDTGGAAALVIALPGAQVSPAWSPDGTKLAFEQHADQKVFIMALTPATEEVRELTGKPGGNEAFPRWSPRGDALAFISTRQGVPRLAVLDLRSHRVRLLH